MIYKKYRPLEILKPFVECYFFWQSTEAVQNLIVESPPSGYCSIVFNCGDDYFLQNKKYEKLAVPKQFIAGQSVYSYKLFLNGNISIAGIVFKPAGLASLFDLPTFEYTEERVPLTKVFRPSFITPFIEKIENAAEANEKIKLLEELVLIHYNKNKPKPDYIDLAANLIIEKNGMINVTGMMKDAFMSRRNFERKFLKKVGLSPKYYARILRISYIFLQIAGKKKADWGSLFSTCEFYDQSHLIKDFIEFTGRTPQQYLEANSELANIVEKPQTNPIKY